MRSIYAVACSAMVMLSAFTACSNDDNNSFELTPEQIAHYEKNREYIREKKQEKDANGKLVYEQLVKYGDTTLYRVIDRKAETPKYPTSSSNLNFELDGHFIDGTTFQNKIKENFVVGNLITGLKGVILETSVGDSIEAILPSTLGYDYQLGQGNIPFGSTLIFNYRVEEAK
ncbi:MULTISPECIES: FKBP-type peptidyl-prolyl cis-trans isomerase [Parabacteroides]|uniref:FKBP-type peptidyl-prolyl cis-trans isomerase n=1 Tax=Parabacteroides leei TaxID=2939491 RepID=UPI0018977A72|nr:FKBP-type peptidyl-prolyl cis-trans isomerase [Parabacteroides goldsteinii]